MNLFTSNFKKLLPRGVLWMVTLFVFTEVGVHIFWNPLFIGEEIFQKLAPSYDYGYNPDERIFYEKAQKFICFPTQYADYRKQSLNIKKDPNEFRIFVYGGSVSRGPEQNNYPVLLEKILNQKSNNKRFRVINFSAQGYGSTRMLLLLKKTISYEPDLLIFHVHGSNEYEDERDLQYMKDANSGINRILFQSHFIVLLKKAYDKTFALSASETEPRAEDEILASNDPVNHQRWLKTIRNHLRETIGIAQQENIPLMLVGRTMKNFGNDEFETRRTSDINHVIQGFSSESKVYYFDTQAIMEANYPESDMRTYFFHDPAHWTIEGHRLIADQLAKVLFEGFMKQ